MPAIKLKADQQLGACAGEGVEQCLGGAGVQQVEPEPAEPAERSYQVRQSAQQYQGEFHSEYGVSLPRWAAEGLRGAICFSSARGAWLRSSNKNISEPIRQHLPRGTKLAVHRQEQLEAIALQLNMHARKPFDFKCSIEAVS